jgi:hypothetical protein
MPTHEVTLQWRDDAEQTIGADANETVIDAAERVGLGASLWLSLRCLWDLHGSRA